MEKNEEKTEKSEEEIIELWEAQKETTERIEVAVDVFVGRLCEETTARQMLEQRLAEMKKLVQQRSW